MSSWTPTTYKTTNWATYNRALKQRGSLSLWFDAAMRWEAAPSGKRGRQRAYSDAAWRTDFNHHRPRTSLAGLTPIEYVNRSEKDQNLNRANLN